MLCRFIALPSRSHIRRRDEATYFISHRPMYPLIHRM